MRLENPPSTQPPENSGENSRPTVCMYPSKDNLRDFREYRLLNLKALVEWHVDTYASVCNITTYGVVETVFFLSEFSRINYCTCFWPIQCWITASNVSGNVFEKTSNHQHLHEYFRNVCG